MIYHVSDTAGLTVLQPKISTHGRAYVYAIENLVSGLLFGAKQDDFDLLICTAENGIPEVYECYPDAFYSVYHGKSCSVYKLREDGFSRGMTSWSPELVCETAVPIKEELRVENLYDRLLEAEKNGELILHRYSRKTEYKKIISEHIVDRLIRFEMLERADKDPRLMHHYGRLINELCRILDGHLLD